MEYQCVQARFLFFNGTNRYTVEFTYGLSTWFVFEDEQTSGAVFNKKIVPAKSKSPNRSLAEDILYEYLQIKQPSK